MSSSFTYGQPTGNNGNTSQSNNSNNNNGTNSTQNTALAALVQQQQQQQSGGTSSPMSALMADHFQQNQQQDLRTLALHQQLSSLMQQTQLQQQQQPIVSQQSQQPLQQTAFSAFLPINQQIRQQNVPPSPLCSSNQIGQQQQQQQTNNGGSTLLGFYQQLIALQAQQQQQQHNSTPTVAALPQQFSNSLHLQNSSPATTILPQQLGGSVQSSQPSSGSTVGSTGLLSTLLASNPALLHSLLGQQQQQQQQQLVALAAQLLLPASQQQQQQSQSPLLQMLNPSNLYAFVNYLQQQQQQPPPVNQQLQLLLQLASNGNTGGSSGGLQGLLASLSGTQQQTLLTALAAQQAQQQETTQQPLPPQLPPPPSLQPQQTDENRLLLEHLIRQSREVQQQQKLLQLEAVAAAGRSQTFVGAGQIEQQTSSLSPPSGGSAASDAISTPQQSQQQQTATDLLAAHQQQQGNIVASIHSQISAEQQEQQRQGQGTPNERLMTSEAVQDRISRLISENEAILEPNPVLLKRRPYQRQSTSNSMTSQTSENAGTSQRGSPGIRSPGPKHHPATTRSFSLHETSFLRFGGGSLTSGQPINRQQLSLQPQPSSQHSQQLTCNFCQLKFPNEAGLEAHELRCSKKDQTTTNFNSSSSQILLQKQQSQPQLKLAHQQRQQQQQLQIQLQQLQDHQSTIAALVGGGKGVARDLVINGNGGGGGRVSSLIQHQQQPRIFSKQQSNVSQLVTCGTSSDSSRLKKRGLDQDNNNNICNNINISGGTDSNEMICEINSSGNFQTDQQQQPGAESSKMARIEDVYSMEITNNNKQEEEKQQNSPKQQNNNNKIQPPILTMRDAIIFAITYSTDLCSTIKMPYFLTLTQNELQDNFNGEENDNNGIRGRTRNITSETFMCLNKVRPTPNEHKDNCSAYYNFWTPSEFCNNVGELQLIQLLLNGSNLFSASWQKRICPLGGHYSLAANRESIQLRTTHSSFWGQQKNVQQNNNSLFNLQNQNCDDLIKNISKNEDKIDELYLQQNQQILKMEIDEKENGNISQQFLPTKMDNNKEENNNNNNIIITKTTDNSIKLLKLPSNNSSSSSKGITINNNNNTYNKFNNNKLKTNNINEEVQISTTQAMVQVYIRGRGRGRYVCERCGIRCKKPSMLKKHLRSHTNVRPFTCMTCNFSFKTKGNLTKHLVSKTHKRRMLDSNNDEIIQGINNNNNTKHFIETNKISGDYEENEGEGHLVVVEEEEDEEENNNIPILFQHKPYLDKKQKQYEDNRMCWEEEDWDDDDEEEDEEWGHVDDNIPQNDVVPPPPHLSYRRFGQENILVERETHTPPTLWTRTDCFGTLAGGGGGYTDVSGDEDEPLDTGWPPQEENVPERICQSAPPSALLSPGVRSKTKRKKKEKIINNSQTIELKLSPPKLEPLVQQQDNQQNQELSPITINNSIINQKHSHQTTLTNFIPSITEQQQQPSLAAQLAAGLLQATNTPFQQKQQQTLIDISKQQQQYKTNNQQQQFYFQQINEQNKQKQKTSSAFAPPTIINDNNNNNNNNLVSALKFIECQMNVLVGSGSNTSQQTTIVGETENNNEGNLCGDSFTTTRGGGPQSTLEEFLATDAQQQQCDICERKFRKESELVLHKQTHLIERKQQQKNNNNSLNSSINSFQCNECPIIVKSKLMLNKHIESVHGRNGNCEQLNNNGQNNLNNSSFQTTSHLGEGPSCSQQMLPPQTNITTINNNHLRNFLCTDCQLGFRSHGVLAKHLRSKVHIKTLVSLGKLPEDTNLLIRDNSKVFANIDASNCEKALYSIKELLIKLREQHCLVNNNTDKCSSTSSSLNLQNIGGIPRISSIGNSTYKRPAEPLPHGLKRKSHDLPNNEDFEGTSSSSSQNLSQQQRRDSFSSPSPQRPKYSRDDLTHQSDSPLHSLAHVAAAAAARQPSPSTTTTFPSLSPLSSSSTYHYQSRIVTANVWVPPRVEQLQQPLNNIVGAVSPLSNNNDLRKSITPEIHNQNGLIISSDRLGSMLSNRSAEETSESTGTRSESSTPVQQRNICQLNQGFSPMPAATRCQICDLNFDSPTQLSVHFHADHILMRHGRDFRCSRRNCEKVFPSRESLRAHIYAHFFGGCEGGKDIDNHLQATPFASVASSPSSPSLLARRSSTAPSAPLPCAQSPDIPEESHSAIGSQLANFGGTNNNNNQSFSSPPSVSSSSFLSSAGITTPKTTGGRIKIQNRRGKRGEENINNLKEKEEISANLLCCQFCSEQLPDVQTLQAHWVKQHMTQLTRPYVCVECDAGFTTELALQAHCERQHNIQNKKNNITNLSNNQNIQNN